MRIAADNVLCARWNASHYFHIRGLKSGNVRTFKIKVQHGDVIAVDWTTSKYAWPGLSERERLSVSSRFTMQQRVLGSFLWLLWKAMLVKAREGSERKDGRQRQERDTGGQKMGGGPDGLQEAKIRASWCVVLHHAIASEIIPIS